jgi:hypothetical protein
MMVVENDPRDLITSDGAAKERRIEERNIPSDNQINRTAHTSY